jgi:hypothetical protein
MVVFWVDAICINQADLDERAQQVKQMRDIYQSAEEVIIDLGEDSPGLPVALNLFQTLLGLGKRMPSSPGNHA